MKKLLTNLPIIVAACGLAFGIVGCSSNTQNQNTGLGAVTGAVIGGLAGSFIGQGTGQVVAIGAGAIAGAFVGGYIGKNMDHTDYQNTCNTLSSNPTNKSSSWKNKHTGTAYKVTPTSNVMAYKGNNTCRRFTTTETMSTGKSQTINGVACRQDNGTWKEIQSS